MKYAFICKVAENLCDETIRTETDIINLSPAYAWAMNVPEHMWTEKYVSYKYVKVFGCRAFAHIPKDERSTLGNKARSMHLS